VFEEVVPEPLYHPTSVIEPALAGEVSLTTKADPSLVVSDPTGSAVGAEETNPTLVLSVNAIN
jgi:hypothetical protein